MLTIDEMKSILEKALPHKRFQHSLYVYETALKMGRHFQGDLDKIGIAALLHDCGREIPTRDSFMYALTHQIPMDFVEEHQPILLHAKLGRYFARDKYGVTNPEILDAIAQTVEQVEQDNAFHALADERWARIRASPRC